MPVPLLKASRHWILLFGIALFVTLGAFGLGSFFGHWISDAPIPVLGTIADFSLLDQTGKPVARKDLQGRVWIADFIFTRCSGQCPLMVGRMKGLEKNLPSEIGFLSFSTDPGYDTVPVIAPYAERYGMRSENWLFLTVEPSVLNRIASSFRMHSIEEPLLHSTRFVLIDRKGRIRGVYDSVDSDRLEFLEKDATRLLRERI